MRKSTLKMTPPVVDPLENVHQERFFRAAQLHVVQYPELKFLAAVPNGGYRRREEAEAFRRRGVRSGVPDVFLPVPRGGFHGWYGELKRYGGTWADVSAAQREWLAFLTSQGYCAMWHKGWEAMWEDIVSYLRLPRP